MARKQTTDSDDEAAVDRLLASWPVGTLATDEERAKMGMEPMDPEERVKRQADRRRDERRAAVPGDGLDQGGAARLRRVPGRRFRSDRGRRDAAGSRSLRDAQGALPRDAQGARL